MCETGRDCSPVAIGALAFNTISSMGFFLIYIYFHATYGVLCEYQHLGYVLVYFIGILDTLGGTLGIWALKKGWRSNYFYYTPGMMCLLLAACFNCFIYVAFRGTLDIREMKEYLTSYVLTYDEAPGVLQDLQKTFGCCGITNYTDYPNSTVSDSCCFAPDCGKDVRNYESRLGCAIPPDGSSTRFVMKISPHGAAIYNCPYILSVTRSIVICIYRCGMLDNIANGIFPMGVPLSSSRRRSRRPKTGSETVIDMLAQDDKEKISYNQKLTLTSPKTPRAKRSKSRTGSVVNGKKGKVQKALPPKRTEEPTTSKAAAVAILNRKQEMRSKTQLKATAKDVEKKTEKPTTSKGVKLNSRQEIKPITSLKSPPSVKGLEKKTGEPTTSKSVPAVHRQEIQPKTFLKALPPAKVLEKKAGEPTTSKLVPAVHKQEIQPKIFLTPPVKVLEKKTGEPTTSKSVPAVHKQEIKPITSLKVPPPVKDLEKKTEGPPSKLVAGPAVPKQVVPAKSQGLEPGPDNRKPSDPKPVKTIPKKDTSTSMHYTFF